MNTFPINAFICTAHKDRGHLMFSRDGKNFSSNMCAYANRPYMTVKINEICMKQNNPETGAPPCRYLTSLNELLIIAELETLGKNYRSILYPQIEYKAIQNLAYEK